MSSSRCCGCKKLSCCCDRELTCRMRASALADGISASVTAGGIAYAFLNFAIDTLSGKLNNDSNLSNTPPVAIPIATFTILLGFIVFGFKYTSRTAELKKSAEDDRLNQELRNEVTTAKNEITTAKLSSAEQMQQIMQSVEVINKSLAMSETKEAKAAIELATQNITGLTKKPLIPATTTKINIKGVRGKLGQAKKTPTAVTNGRRATMARPNQVAPLPLSAAVDKKTPIENKAPAPGTPTLVTVGVTPTPTPIPTLAQVHPHSSVDPLVLHEAEAAASRSKAKIFAHHAVLAEQEALRHEAAHKEEQKKADDKKQSQDHKRSQSRDVPSTTTSFFGFMRRPTVIPADGDAVARSASIPTSEATSASPAPQGGGSRGNTEDKGVPAKTPVKADTATSWSLNPVTLLDRFYQHYEKPADPSQTVTATAPVVASGPGPGKQVAGKATA